MATPLYLNRFTTRETPENHCYGHERRRMQCHSSDYGHRTKLRLKSVTSRIQPDSDVISCTEMNEQRGYIDVLRL